MSNFPSTKDNRPVQRRVGDAERDRCVDELSRSFGAGRLTPYEFERRSQMALEAATASDLEMLTQDLADAEPTSDVAATTSSPALVLRHIDVAKVVLFLAVVGAIAFIGSEGDMGVWLGWWLFGAASGGAGVLLARGRRNSR